MPLVLEPEWLGRRVVVRRVVEGDSHGPMPAPMPAPMPGPIYSPMDAPMPGPMHGSMPGPTHGSLYTDVLGDLIVLDPVEIVVDTRLGAVTVARADIASARLVLPSTAAVLALEATSARGWRAHEVESNADGWLLRADRGWTGRANSALALRTLRRPLADALGDLRRWYDARGLPARVQVPQPAAAPLGLALGRLGWPAADATDVLVGRLDLLARAVDRRSAGIGPAVDLDDRPDDDWLDGYRYRGGGPLPAGAVELLTRHDQVVFARVRAQGRTVAVGRGAVDAGWLGITAIDVAAEYRGHGLGTDVTAALGRWGAGLGATRAYLQTDETNGPAHALFGRLGFHRHHSYHYRSAPTID